MVLKNQIKQLNKIIINLYHEKMLSKKVEKKNKKIKSLLSKQS